MLLFKNDLKFSCSLHFSHFYVLGCFLLIYFYLSGSAHYVKKTNKQKKPSLLCQPDIHSG